MHPIVMFANNIKENYLELEMLDMIKSDTWKGGNVTGIGYVSGEVVVTGKLKQKSTSIDSHVYVGSGTLLILILLIMAGSKLNMKEENIV
jgi:hypothetical protein